MATDQGQQAACTDLLDLPDAVLHSIFDGMDVQSRKSCCITCRRWRAHPTINSAFRSLLVDWKKARGKYLSWRWPKHAPPPQHLTLCGKKTSYASPNMEAASNFLSRYAAKAKTVTGLHLKDWNIDDDGSLPEDLFPLDDCLALLPQLSSLTFERCCGFDEGPAATLMSLTNLQSLTFKDMDLDYDAWMYEASMDGTDSPLTYMLEQLGENLTELTNLTHLSITGCGKFRTLVYVNALGNLKSVQHLELALPAMGLQGLEEVAAGCTRLTYLKLVHTGALMVLSSAEDRRYMASRDVTPLEYRQAIDGDRHPLRDDDRCAWPALVEAHVVGHWQLLDQMGLLISEAAPALQRLYLQLLDQEVPAGGFPALTTVPALQQPLVFHNLSPAVLAALAPAADTVKELVLVKPRWGSGVEAVTETAAILKQMPQLQQLSVFNLYPNPDQLEKLLSADLGNVQHVVLGMNKAHTGNNCFAPVHKQAQSLEKVLHNLLSGRSGVSAGGRGRGRGRGGQRGGMAGRVGAASSSTSTSTPSTPLHVHFGCWCPKSQVDPAATKHSFGYSKLCELAGRARRQQVPQGQHVGSSDAGSTSSAAEGPSSSIAAHNTSSSTAGPAQAVHRNQRGTHRGRGRGGRSPDGGRGGHENVQQHATAAAAAAPANTATGPPRYIIHEAPGGSAADMALGGHAWLQPHLDRLHELWEEFRTDVNGDEDDGSSGSYDYNYLNHVYGGMGYEDGIPLQYLMGFAPPDDIFGL